MTESMIAILVVVVVVAVGISWLFFRPMTEAPKPHPNALPFMKNVHFLVMVAASIVIFVVSVEAYGADLPEYVISLISAFIGGIGSAYGTILTMYRDRE